MLDIRPRDASGTPAAWQEFWPLLMGSAAVGAVALTQRLLAGPGTLLADGLGLVAEVRRQTHTPKGPHRLEDKLRPPAVVDNE